MSLDRKCRGNSSAGVFVWDNGVDHNEASWDESMDGRRRSICRLAFLYIKMTGVTVSELFQPSFTRLQKMET